MVDVLIKMNVKPVFMIVISMLIVSTLQAASNVVVDPDSKKMGHIAMTSMNVKTKTLVDFFSMVK